MAPIPQKILILQLRRIGDVVFTSPVARILRENFPQAKIDFLTERPAHELIRLNPYLNETLVYEKKKSIHWLFEIRRRKYDVILDYHSNGRSLLLTFFSGAALKVGFDGPLTRSWVYHRLVKSDRNQFIVLQKLDLLKVLPIRTEPLTWSWDIQMPEEPLKRAANILKSRGVKSSEVVIGFAPLHRHPIRAWSPERFAELARILTDRYRCWILLLGGPGEGAALDGIARSIPDRAIPMAATQLLELSAFIQQCKIFVANDNGPQKIAMALGVPTVTLFGPTNPLSISPNQPLHASLRDEKLFCIGCELKKCPYRHECMRHISAPMVLSKIQSILESLNSIPKHDS
ncbi:MAG: glycosyltransferase family 9 protein [Elusimicrobia bacterium]|nr:glycosyltransferase family 9 protein [Elusimicrobiota bacterium]